MMKIALNPSIKTKLKSKLLKIKEIIFRQKMQLLLPESIDLNEKIRPEESMRILREENNIEKSFSSKNAKNTWWTLNSDEKEAVNKANVIFAKKHEKMEKNSKNYVKDNKDYDEH